MIPDLNGLRVAVVGIGNELKGDDAAGVLVARALKKWQIRQVGHRNSPGKGDKQSGSPAEVLVVDAGPAPENFSGPLRRFCPDWVILVDAAEMAQPPGTFTWVDWQDVDGFSGSTHILPPSIIARFLFDEIGCQVAFIGIQPTSLEFDRPVSLVVTEAVEKVTHQLRQMLSF
ncbi:MAG: hydrogenase 3 maturation endopeptidase HyCI [Anaerolineaceae bacterium]|nr:hydrogenase 3 maturation endopeptidase HyCI [Anaerolineaceae bacterium]